MNKKKTGYTLIEMIITMTLIVVVLSVILTMFNIGSNMVYYTTNKSDLQLEAQSIQEKISKIGMQARDIDIEKNDDTTQIIFNSYDEYGNEFSYYIIYYDNKLAMKDNIKSEKYKLEFENVSRFNITPNENYKNENIFNITIELQKGHYKNAVDYTFDTTIVLRNKN